MKKLQRWLRTKQGQYTAMGILAVLVIAGLWLGGGGLQGTAVLVSGDWKCLPSCTDNDARLFSMVGGGPTDSYEGLTGREMSFTIVSKADQSTFQLGIFDGDTFGSWDHPFNGIDRGPSTTFRLYADPMAEGATGKLVAEWDGNTLANNGWSDMVVTNDSAAKNSNNGNYIYRLEASHDNTIKSLNHFKVRTDGATIGIAKGTAFSINSFVMFPDMPKVYPNWPDTSTTTYDGTYTFYLDVPKATPFIAIWDGDLDYGDCTAADDDDLDTASIDFRPEWATDSVAVVEGVASVTQRFTDHIGCVATGSPVENSRSALWRRGEPVQYTITAPDGRTWTNTNPSGNKEWEQFRIDSDRARSADHYVDGLLPGGTYKLELSGLDMSNMSAWHFDFDSVPCDTPDCNVITICEDCGSCVVDMRHPLLPDVANSGGQLYSEVMSNGDVYVWYAQSTQINDNSYSDKGAEGTVGWGSKMHDWRKLWKSDQTRYELKDGNGNVVLDLYMDYIDQVPDSTTGWATTGPYGPDGSIVSGDVNWVYDWTSSMQRNMERYCQGKDCVANGHDLTLASPKTQGPDSYVIMNDFFSAWDYQYWVSFHVKAEAFGDAGFGSVAMTDVHNSNAKIGEDRYCVGGGCGVCVPTVDNAKMAQPASVVAPSAQAAPAAVVDQPGTAELTACTAAKWATAGNKDWQGYRPNDKADSLGLSKKTKLSAVLTGSDGDLMKEVIAGLLNAANSNISYPYSEGEVLVMSTESDGLKKLQDANNLGGCPLK